MRVRTNPTPVRTPGSGTLENAGVSDVVVSCGPVWKTVSHTIGLKSDGTVWTWGYNVYGQLGDGSTSNRSLPGLIL